MPADRPQPAAHNPLSPFSLGVGIVGLAGVAALFLPFAGNASPLAAVGALVSDDLLLTGLWRLGVPSLLAILVAAGAIRWTVSGQLSRAERFVAHLAALVAACCLLSLYATGTYSFLTGHGDAANWPYGVVYGASIPPGLNDWLIFACPWLGVMAGACLLRRNTRTCVRNTANALTAMQIIYVVVAVFCLASFRSVGWQIGAYLVAATTVAYLAQIIAVSVAAPGHPAPTQN